PRRALPGALPVWPPKERATPSTTRMGSGLATPGRGATPVRAAAPSAIDQCLPAGAEHSLRSEHQQCHQPQAYEDEPDLGRSGRVEYGADPRHVGLGLSHHTVDEIEEELEDDGPEHRP